MDMPSMMAINVRLNSCYLTVTTIVDAGMGGSGREINGECIRARELLLILRHDVRDQRQQIQLMHREKL